MNDPRTRERFDARLVLKAETAESTSTNGSANDIGSLPEASLAWLSVSAATGDAPTLDVAIDGSHDGESWTEVACFAQATASGRQFVPVGPQSYRTYRYRSTLGGDTPVFTYSVVLSI